MIYNVSYNNKKISDAITQLVGPPFSLKERWNKRGIGSSKLIITETSEQISNLLNLDSNRNQCNIEMRPQGIIVGFRSLLESYAIAIPYHKLVIYKGEAETYSIYMDSYLIKIEAKAKDKATHKFIKKVMDAKAEQAPVRIEDL